MNQKHLIVTSIAISLSLFLGGCATIKDAYISTTDTVKGWVSSDPKKSDEKKPEVKPLSKSEDKKPADIQLDESKAK